MRLGLGDTLPVMVGVGVTDAVMVGVGVTDAVIVTVANTERVGVAEGVVVGDGGGGVRVGVGVRLGVAAGEYGTPGSPVHSVALRPATSPGLSPMLLVLPVISCPRLFSPQSRDELSASMTAQCHCPHARAVTGSGSGTLPPAPEMGADTKLVLPRPSIPHPL